MGIWAGRRAKASFAAAVVAAALGIAGAARAADDTFGLGDGHTGAGTVSSASTQVNAWAQISARVNSGATSLTYTNGYANGASAGDPFSVSDLVMLWQPATTGSAPVLGDQSPVDLSASAVGRWELARVTAVDTTANTLTFSAIRNSSGFDANLSQVVRVPEYTTLTVNTGASITAAAWNGQRGGIVAFFATGAVTVNGTGFISADGVGFRGGPARDIGTRTGCALLDGTNTNGYAMRGEGIENSLFVANPGNNSLGGRGNVADGAGGGDCHNSGGGGGGHGGRGGTGGFTNDGSRDFGGLGGSGLLYWPADHLSFGAGGGAGEVNDNNGTSGAAGGGVILIRAASVNVTGTGRISADGANAGNATNDGAGGGGAGGAIYLRTTGAANCASLRAVGGNGGNASADHGPGAGGAGGRVFLQSASGSCASVVNVNAGLAGTAGGLNRGATPTSATDATAKGTSESWTNSAADAFCISNTPCASPRPVCRFTTTFNAGLCVQCTAGDSSACTAPGATRCATSGPNANKCVECAQNSHCGGTKPVCDLTTNLCVECLAGADCTADPTKPVCGAGGVCRSCVVGDCSGATPACAASGPNQGRCVACTTNPNCGASSPVCDPSNNTCVGCLVPGDCTYDPARPFCELSTKVCRGCSVSDCSSPTPACATSGGNNGHCVQCTDASTCGGALPLLCNTTTNLCVECLNGSDCTADSTKPICGAGGTCRSCVAGDCTGSTSVCAPTTDSVQPGHCVQCTPASAVACVSATPFCSPSTDTCVGCRDGNDCSGSTPFCGAGNVCRGCLASDCTGATPVCESSGANAGHCVVCTAASHALCTGLTPICNPATNACVGCLVSPNCSGATPICGSGVCRACLADLECSFVGGVCETSASNASVGRCVQCTSLAPCSNPLTCSPVTDTCVGCYQDSQCANPSPICGVAGSCRGCSSSGECGNAIAGTVCNLAGALQGSCTPCTTADTSRCPVGAPRCNATGQCVECSLDAHCSLATKPLCDNQACVACANDFGSGPPLSCPTITRPVCDTSGALAGACVQCTSTDATRCTGDTPVCRTDVGTCGCTGDPDCGAADSGRVCTGAAAGVCGAGCRGTGGNGCPAGQACSSTTNAIGTCQTTTPDGGPPDSGPPDSGPPDSGPPDSGPADSGSSDSSTPDAGPGADSGNPDADGADGSTEPPPYDPGSLEGGGCACGSASGLTPVALLALGAVASAFGRRRRA